MIALAWNHTVRVLVAFPSVIRSGQGPEGTAGRLSPRRRSDLRAPLQSSSREPYEKNAAFVGDCAHVARHAPRQPAGERETESCTVPVAVARAAPGARLEDLLQLGCSNAGAVVGHAIDDAFLPADDADPDAAVSVAAGVLEHGLENAL